MREKEVLDKSIFYSTIKPPPISKDLPWDKRGLKEDQPSQCSFDCSATPSFSHQRLPREVSYPSRFLPPRCDPPH